MQPTIEELRAKKPIIDAAARRFGALNVRVFGSVARGDANASSDIDILVKMEPGRTLLDLIGFEQTLEDEFGVSFDVVEEGGIHPLLESSILSQALAL